MCVSQDLIEPLKDTFMHRYGNICLNKGYNQLGPNLSLKQFLAITYYLTLYHLQNNTQVKSLIFTMVRKLHLTQWHYS